MTSVDHAEKQVLNWLAKAVAELVKRGKSRRWQECVRQADAWKAEAERLKKVVRP